jgi:hypothetical protein
VSASILFVMKGVFSQNGTMESLAQASSNRPGLEFTQQGQNGWSQHCLCKDLSYWVSHCVASGSSGGLPCAFGYVSLTGLASERENRGGCKGSRGRRRLQNRKQRGPQYADGWVGLAEEQPGCICKVELATVWPQMGAVGLKNRPSPLGSDSLIGSFPTSLNHLPALARILICGILGGLVKLFGPWTDFTLYIH